MAIDVNKPSSSDYPTKLTSAIPSPPYRDHHHNKNQTISIINIQDQATGSSAIRPNIASVVFASEDDFRKISLEDIFPDSSDDDHDNFTPSISDIFPTTTTAMTTDTATTAEMTLEEIQQWEDEHYEAEDRAEQVAWPKSKREVLAADMDADIFAPFKDTPGFTASDQNDYDDKFTAITTTDEEANVHKNQVMLMITEDTSNKVTTRNDYYDNNQTIPNTTAKDQSDPPGFSVLDQVDKK